MFRRQEEVRCESRGIKTTLPLLISITRWLLINGGDGVMICCRMYEERAVMASVDFLIFFLLFFFFPLLVSG